MATSSDQAGSLAYLAVVGRRPAPIAVAVKTLGARACAIGCITTTTESVEVCQRLERFWNGATRAERITAFLSRDGDLPLADLLTSITRWAEREADGARLALHVDPGFGFASSAVVRGLVARRVQPILLSTPASVLIEIDTSDGKRRPPVPLDDLELDELLKLYEIPLKYSNDRCDVWGDLPHRMVANLELPGYLKLARACERGGRLYGIVTIPKNRRAEGRAEFVRTTATRRVSSKLNHLLPSLTFCRADGQDGGGGLAEAESAGFETIPYDSVSSWTAPVALPGREATIELRVVGRERSTGQPLVAWFGKDPSATLSAIASHEPSRAIVIVDKTDPDVVEKATRLRDCAKDLGCRLQLVGATFDGVLDDPESIPTEGEFNATPGTRLQAASVAAAHSLSLWSLDRERGVRPLAGPAPNVARPLKAASLSTIIHVECGGQGGRGVSEVTNPDFLCDHLAPLILTRPFNNAANLFDFASEDVRVFQMSNGGDGHPGVAYVTIDGQSGFVRSEVNDGSGGLWLEDAIAVCLDRGLRSARREDAEILIGTKIPYTDRAILRYFAADRGPGESVEEQRARLERTDIDVLLRLGTDVFLFDAKAGRNEHAADHRERAMARAMMIGRFCVPVAVRPVISDPRPAPGAAELGLVDLLESAPLVRRLEGFADARRRVRNDGDA